MKIKYILLLALTTVLLAGCDYSKSSNRDGFFFNTFAKPMDQLLHWLGHNLNNNYGLAIIVIVLVIRLVMLPFMLSQTKNGQIMRKVMEFAKPDMKEAQEKVKRARTQEEKMEAQQEMMKVYKKYDINPMKNMLGCLPILIQMPVLFGLYVALKWPSQGGILDHPNFLWFKLTEPDIWITIIAGVLYFLQSLVSLENMPKEQRQMGYMMMIISPIFIVYISLTSASALGLYWSVSAIFMIVQMFFANRYYSKVADEEVARIKREQAKKEGKDKKPKNTKVVAKKKKKK
ncbi:MULTISPECIES: membrane protein insertase YidC [Staphylococcus]|uniref:membrane protein insertase YidC n=1 Tax=Staphylococcus TaxID=1279 RepID=UPI000DF80A04|nr:MULTISPECIES: membrane protein insertase YidC [unclassified Staphylococcus]UXV35209.1 membrane protein insertase YidC [Staphylococcus sp. IVB6181]